MKTFESRTNYLTIKFIFTFAVFYCLTMNSYGQRYFENDTTGTYYARQELKYTLKNPIKDNFVDKTRILLDTKEKAVNFAELILFDIYGKENIEEERPYRIYNIDNYWIMEGTLHADVGGVFLIIIDSHDCRILKIIHGK